MCCMTMPSNYRQQNFTSFQIRCFLGGRRAEYPQSVQSLKARIEHFTQTSPCREVEKKNGEPIEFEWNIFPGHNADTTPENDNIQPENFKDGIIFMSLYNGIGQVEKAMKKAVNAILCLLPNMRESFPKDIGRSSDLDQKNNGMLRSPTNPDGSWNRAAEQMMTVFAESGHLVFRGTRTSKGGGKTSIHHNTEPATAELLLLSPSISSVSSEP